MRVHWPKMSIGHPPGPGTACAGAQVPDGNRVPGTCPAPGFFGTGSRRAGSAEPEFPAPEGAWNVPGTLASVPSKGCLACSRHPPGPEMPVPPRRYPVFGPRWTFSASLYGENNGQQLTIVRKGSDGILLVGKTQIRPIPCKRL